MVEMSIDLDDGFRFNWWLWCLKIVELIDAVDFKTLVWVLTLCHHSILVMFIGYWKEEEYLKLEHLKDIVLNIQKKKKLTWWFGDLKS